MYVHITLIIIASLFACMVPAHTLAQYITIDQSNSSIDNPSAILNLNLRSGNNIIFGDSDIYLLNSVGNVGIYESAPTYKLQVTGIGYFSQPILVGTPTNVGHAATKSYVDSMVGGGIASGISGQTLRHSGVSWTNSSLITNTATNIGIGTTSPSAPLHLYSATPVGNILSLFESGSASGLIKITSTGSSWNIGSTGSGFQFYNNNTSAYRMTITNSGNVGIGTTSPGYILDVQGGTTTFDNPVIVGTPTAATHAATKNYVDSALNTLWIASSTLIYPGNSGNVGIGSTNPQGKLEVVGTVRASTFQLGTSATAGYVLTADVNGNATWQLYTAGSASIGANENVLYLRSNLSSPKSFTFETYTSNISSYFTCPSGYTVWSNGNAYWYGDENGNIDYIGVCYPSASDSTFKWRAYSSPASVTCPSGYTAWYANTYGRGTYSSYTFYDGVCYKGTPTTFTWEVNSSQGSVTCPTGLTNWNNANAWWYGSGSGYQDFTGACYDASATTNVFEWKSYSSPSSVTCPSGYTAWYASQLTYGPGSYQYYSGACYKGTPPSFPWKLYTGYTPSSAITCPSGYTNWYDTTYAKYFSYDGSYYAYNGACVNTSVSSGDAIPYFSTSGSDSVTCPTGYTKWQGNASYYAYKGSSNATYSSACYKVASNSCFSCPSGWTAGGSCNTRMIGSSEVNEQMCYQSNSAYQVMTIKKKGSNQSLSCPTGWSAATSTQNIASNSELVCYGASCPSGLSIPGVPTGVTATSTMVISWTAPSGSACSFASSYKVYRSTTSGSGFSSIATGVTSTSYLDSGAVGGTTYYYTVSSVNSAGEGVQSAEVSATAPTALYTFTSHTFTPCGVAGANGPSLAQCQSTYSAATWAQNTSYLNVTSGIQYWTVPATATYTIDVYGAQGGNYSYPGGYGARSKGDFSLTAGTVLKILVGQRAGSTSYAGGGGGSFVTLSNNTPLAVAGGGNATSPWSSTTAHGVNTTYGTGGSNGTGGSGGGGGSGYGGSPGGAGLTGNGAAASSCQASYPLSFINGGTGSTSCNGEGGFGGGSATDGCCQGQSGPGGGYSGGGASNGGGTYGGGGGSYNSGTNQTITTGAQTGAGQVIIQKL